MEIVSLRSSAIKLYLSLILSRRHNTGWPAAPPARATPAEQIHLRSPAWFSTCWLCPKEVSSSPWLPFWRKARQTHQNPRMALRSPPIRENLNPCGGMKNTDEHESKWITAFNSVNSIISLISLEYFIMIGQWCLSVYDDFKLYNWSFPPSLCWFHVSFHKKKKIYIFGF